MYLTKGEIITCLKGFMNFRNTLMTIKSFQYTIKISWGMRTSLTVFFKSESAVMLTKYFLFKMANTFS